MVEFSIALIEILNTESMNGPWENIYSWAMLWVKGRNFRTKKSCPAEEYVEDLNAD